MFPFCFEWHWDMPHLVFMGGVWYASAIVGIGMGYCIVKSIVDTIKEQKPKEQEKK